MKRTTLVLALLTAFLFPTAAYAQGGIVYGDSIPAGVVVNHDVLLLGSKVSIDGVVNGNTFILGNQVVINGSVNGSLVMLAQNAAIGGQISQAVYAAALTLDLPETAALSRDLYALTVSLTSKPASSIERHLFALGLDAGLNGRIGGDLHTVIGPIQLYNGAVRLLGFEELTLQLHFDVPPAPPAPSSGTAPGSAYKVSLRFKFQDPLPAFDWGAWAIDILRSWGTLFGLGLLVMWRARSWLEESGAPLRARPGRTLGLGLLVLAISLNLFLVALMLVAVVFAIGLGLNAIDLWPLSIALWVIVYAHIAVALTLLVLFVLYGTKILVSYHFVAWLIGRTTWPRTTWMAVLILLIGTLFYSLLRSVPYVGWVVGLLVIALGMGSAWRAFRDAPPRAQVAPAAEPSTPAPRRSGRSAR